MDIMSLPSIGPYTGVSHDRIVQKGERTFRLIIYGAYNAMGLIGSECNGIAVLDEDQTQVLLDEEAKETTGYFGPSQRQISRLAELVAMSLDEFREFVGAHPRARYTI